VNWFDTHLDLTSFALCGRDMRCPDPATSGGENAPGGITFPSLARGNVRACLGTIFIEPDGNPPALAYTSLDAQSAPRAARAQLDLYHYWHAQNLINLVPGTFANAPLAPDRLTLGILVEGADGILKPDDLAWWQQRGVVAIGLAWVKQTRYAGGNSTTTGPSWLVLMKK